MLPLFVSVYIFRFSLVYKHPLVCVRIRTLLVASLYNRQQWDGLLETLTLSHDTQQEQTDHM
jgi:hypothetical protein